MSVLRKTVPLLRHDIGHDSHLMEVRRNTYQVDCKGEVLSDADAKPQGMGLDLIGLLIITQLVMKWVSTMLVTGETFLYMSYHIPAPTMQVYSAMVSIPEVMKPLLGLISDAFPIRGYSKTPYALLFSLTGLIACFAIGFSPSHPMGTGLKSFFFFANLPQPAFSIGMLVLCLVFVHMMTASAEVFTAGLLAEKINKALDGREIVHHTTSREKTNNLLMVFVITGLFAGIGAQGVSGWLLEHSGVPKIFLIGAVMSVSLPLWVIFRGFGDTYQTPEQITKVRTFLRGQKEIVGLSIIMSVGCAFMLFVPLAGGNGVMLNLIVALTTSLVVISAFVVFLTPVIATILLCFFLSATFTFNIQSAFMYFVLDNQYQFPTGPQFSRFFVSFWIPLAGTCGGMLGLLAFRYMGMNWGLRNWELTLAFTLVPVNLFHIAFVYRWNVSHGISDHAWCLIDTVALAFTLGAQCLPFTWAIPRMCPIGLESCMMQLLGGCLFMGGIVSEDIGALLLQWNGVTPSGAFFEQDKFDNLGRVTVIRGVVTCVVAFLVLPLLPNIRAGDKLIQNERPDAATYNSIWRRWMKYDSADLDEATRAPTA